jgi:hypothetical protein
VRWLKELASPLAARATFGVRPKGDAVTLTARQTLEFAKGEFY